MKQNSVCAFALLFGLIIFFNSCRYDDTAIMPSSNIILHDKPLYVIKVNVQGKWKLVKASGGICVTCPVQIKRNPYIIIKDDRIVAGNDSLGITLDTIIVWKRDKDVFGDYTYLLTYTDSKNYFFPYEAIVDCIKNDTLIIIDNANDGYNYYFQKAEQH